MTLAKIYCNSVEPHAHVPDGTSELWEKTCEVAFASLLTPFLATLTRPLVLLQQALEHNGQFVRFAVLERVVQGVRRIEAMASQKMQAEPGLSEHEASRRAAVEFSGMLTSSASCWPSGANGPRTRTRSPSPS